ncbi:translation initiation factor 2 [Pseudomonas sp. 10B1]|uniref:translation initiation factor 2 n=1 Tax=unclassified Pseudomonas TaxID=196821 RepID=UPI002AB4BA55|nr:MULTISPECIES: translation initiation factor 2 [unclassified Pseudomonas]MDY7561125.1 translation initiation factor 2 [Pseudomonas sp. AB6]MEA9979608.1 translation initiation factor 2 [Pseudomonas sp. RTS4]MEA9997245.1 translation initiation factor 2 [Pseudomonas sp. AA4]MEB0089022.1 translation initiation factor 2 [Pseudomonas sp. RTI1]MEB0128304.1 translation initiation factor 2 [Pseudomonas sp. CCC1.2]
MRSGSMCLLLVLLSVGINAQAEETSTPAGSIVLPLSTGNRIADLQQRLTASEQQREKLSQQIQNTNTEPESSQLSRLRLENQRLTLQLKESLAAAPLRMFTEQQQWFVTGGGVAMIALLCGIFASGWRRQRRQWLN